jgi:hypothetical protein
MEAGTKANNSREENVLIFPNGNSNNMSIFWYMAGLGW